MTDVRATSGSEPTPEGGYTGAGVSEALRAIRCHPNPFIVTLEPRTPQIARWWPETPNQRALRVILATHTARLWQLPPEPDTSPWVQLLELHADIAAAVDSVDSDEVTFAGIRALAGVR